MSGPDKKFEQEGGVATQQETERKLSRPRLYRVLLHNDDFTLGEFVVALLMHVFHHGEATALSLMREIERAGVGIAGIYTFEIAETKVAEVMELAEENEYPLLCTLEPDEEPDENEK